MTERPTTFDKAPRPRTTILEDLLETDSRLLAQVARRVRLVRRAAHGRQVLDRELEKNLWSAFDAAGRQQDLDPRLTRQLFALLGGFGLETSGGRRAADKPFTLSPRSEPADIDMTGPRSRARARMLTALAAATGQPLRLAGVILTDPLVELVKALNQCGAHLSWTEDALEAAAPEKPLKAERPPRTDVLDDGFPLRFEETLVFAGEDPSTLYILLAFALREAGRCKFAGGAGLKGLDLHPVENILPKLGARIASMNPRSRGVPVRLESGGRMAGGIDLSDDTPPLFAQALALAAWSYPEGLRLNLCADPVAAAAQAAALDEAVAVLNLCQVKAKRKGAQYLVPAAAPKLPKEPALPMDPALCAYVLAIPAMAGGTAKLRGELALPAQVAADFATLGLTPAMGPGMAECSGVALSAGQRLDMGRAPQFLPLALALAVKAGGAVVSLPAGAAAAPARAWAMELLDRLGASFADGGNAPADSIEITSGATAAWEDVCTAPDAWSVLGLALLSFERPGVALDNPGDLTALWPKFWSLFNALPAARDTAFAPKEPEKHDEKPKNRRVKV